MGRPYAEVIGDPVAHSRSPAMHKAWLAALGLEADYRATRVAPGDLADYLADRRADRDWRGCNVTLPHKQAILPLLDHVDAPARRIGAVNCVYRGAKGLHGCNTDFDGIAAVLDGLPLAGEKVAVIGAGGAARAALDYLAGRNVACIALLVRDPTKAADLQMEVWSLQRCDGAMAGARLVINASPMGMTGGPDMPAPLLACVAAHAPGSTMFDMVYAPLETPFLAAARAMGGSIENGLTMLEGQGRAAFRRFFGAEPSP